MSFVAWYAIIIGVALALGILAKIINDRGEETWAKVLGIGFAAMIIVPILVAFIIRITKG